MTTREATPAPWEIWHARFNFDDRGYKFRPVLVLSRTQDGLLGSIRPIRARMAGDLTTHRRRTTPNQTSDTHLGQASLQPHHNRRTILNTQQPTAAHNQPLQQHRYHTNCLHPMTLPSDHFQKISLILLRMVDGILSMVQARLFLKVTSGQCFMQ